MNSKQWRKFLNEHGPVENDMIFTVLKDWEKSLKESPRICICGSKKIPQVCGPVYLKCRDCGGKLESLLNKTHQTPGE